jgi:hypothetical protein
LTFRSYISVFNSFRSDLEDFQLHSLSNLTTHKIFSFYYLPNLTVDNLNYSENSHKGVKFRVSNPATLRSSVRNSVVNSNAFQKVFKARLDESRALVNSSSFADLATKQPFLSDSSISYFQLLGKNRTNFFSTPLYLARKHIILNTVCPLFIYMNVPFYDFPFLPSKTSDIIRFT